MMSMQLEATDQQGSRRMTDLLQLAERVEAATADQQNDALITAFYAIFPKPNPENEPEWPGSGHLRQPRYHAWYVRLRKFTAMLDAEAYESAALMLVPDGWMLLTLSDIAADGLTLCKLGAPDVHDAMSFGTSTRALAITAAALRARAAKEVAYG